MSRISGKLNLLQLHAVRKMISGKAGAVECLVIPIEKNRLFIGEKGIYLDLIAFEIEKLSAEADLKARLMETEFQYQMQLKDIDTRSLQSRETERETAKAGRISQQNTEQSKLIDQRSNNLPPVSFESNEDSLDGFDMAEFSPR